MRWSFLGCLGQRRWLGAALIVLACSESRAGAAAASAQTLGGPLTSVDSSSTTEPQGGVPRVLTLDAALDLARRGSQRLTTAGALIQSARGRVVDAGRRPNPSLAGSIENWGGSLGSGRTESTMEFAQGIETGGKRTARVAGARADEHWARADSAVEGRDLERESTEAFLDAWVAQETLKRLRETEHSDSEVVVAAAERLRVGAASPAEGLRAGATLALRRAEILRTVAELNNARFELALQWGATVVTFDSVALAPPDLTLPPSADSLLVRLGAHPELARAEAEVVVAAARFRLARAGRIPNVEMRAGVRRLNELDATGFVAGVSLPLPLWNTQTGNIAAAEAEQVAAHARRSLVAQRLTSRLFALREQLRLSIEACVGIRDGALPRTDEALKYLRSGYRAGRLSYVDVAEGRRATLEAQMAYLQVARDVWSTRLALLRLLGAAMPATAGEEKR